MNPKHRHAFPGKVKAHRTLSWQCCSALLGFVRVEERAGDRNGENPDLLKQAVSMALEKA